MSIQFLSSIYPIKILDTHPITAMYTGIKSRFVSTITSEFGLSGIALANGFILGISTVWAVDCHSSEEKDFQNRWKYLTGAGITTLTIPGTALVSLSSKINAKTAMLFAALSSGVILGIRIQDYYNKNSDQKINEFIQGLGGSPRYGIGTELNLSGYRGSLNYFNLTKLGQKIRERFNADPELQLLDLSNTDLTDDNLREMAQTGLFDNVPRLVLSDNPRLSGRGIAWIAEKGFTSLQELDLSDNEQIIKINLNEWTEKDGFKNLTSLNLAATGITEDKLAQMIEKAEWFRKLKGLNLDRNDAFERFPPSILELTDLDDHEVSDEQRRNGGPIRFKGKGIFCRTCRSLTCTKELLELANKGKVHGEVQNLTLDIKGIFERMDLKQVYERYNVPFEEDR